MFKMMLGEVDRLEGHFVGTEFLSFIGPLLPVRSMYVTAESMQHSGNTTTLRWEGIDIPIRWKSVFLGYLRVWSMIGVFAAPFLLMWGEPVEFDRPEYLVSVALFALWLFAILIPGRLSKREKARLSVLRRLTGIGLDPRHLDQFSRMTKIDALLEAMKVASLPVDPETAKSSIPGLAPERRDLLFVYASFAAVEEPRWSDVREAAGRSIEESRS